MVKVVWRIRGVFTIWLFLNVISDNIDVLFLFCSILEQIRAVAGNDKCADCGSPGENKTAMPMCKTVSQEPYSGPVQGRKKI